MGTEVMATSTKQAMNITTRDMSPSDFPFVADISAAALDTDELFAYLYPHRHKYPVGYRDHFLRTAKSKYYSSGRRCFIAEVSEAESEQTPLEPDAHKGRKTVVGWAAWKVSAANGEIAFYDPDERKNHQPRQLSNWHRALELILLSLESSYRSLFSLDWAVSPTALSTLNASSQPQSPPPFTFPTPNIYLTNLVVSPSHQRLGIGTKLMQFGFELARREHLPIVLKASTVGRLMYQRLGFSVVGVEEVGEEVRSWGMVWEESEGEVGEREGIQG